VFDISWQRLFEDEEFVVADDDEDEAGGASSFKFIFSTVTHSSRRRL